MTTTRHSLPSSFSLRFSRADRCIYRLDTSQVLPLPRDKAFTFFQDPGNLFEITPDWLHFNMKDRDGKALVFEGAEFDYTIRWFGLTIPWRGRIMDYKPPERFTDVQIKGPYRLWSHLHTFDDMPGGTLMRDTVMYRLPFGLLGSAVHALTVRRQLEDIFTFRASRIDEWARGRMKRKA
jgi:ligand-binding SRPBCC domain-containing protein